MWEIQKLVGCGNFKIVVVHLVLMNNYRLSIISQRSTSDGIVELKIMD